MVAMILAMSSFDSDDGTLPPYADLIRGQSCDTTGIHSSVPGSAPAVSSMTSFNLGMILGHRGASTPGPSSFLPNAAVNRALREQFLEGLQVSSDVGFVEVEVLDLRAASKY